MKTSPLLMAAGLIFWGWQTGHLMAAGLLAAVVEGAGITSYRWEFSFSDCSRAADLCTVLLLSFSVYFFFTIPIIDIILAVIRWLPVILLPLIAVQQYGIAEGIDLRAFFILGRKNFGEERAPAGSGINLTYPYLGVCLLSAAAANNRDPRFYAGLAALAAWALFPYRSKRYPVAVWLLFLLLGTGAGYVGHIGLHGLQLLIEEKGPGWFADLTREDTDPFRNRTAIGEIGDLKLSDRILFRVKPEKPYRLPILLRDSSFNVYRFSTWYARKATFSRIFPENDGTTWRLDLQPAIDRGITITMPVRFEKSVLKLPRHSLMVSDLPVSMVERNRLGTVRATGGPGLLSYTVRGDNGFSLASAPDETDLTLPAMEAGVLQDVAAALHLRSKPPEEMLAAVESFFSGRFNYSLTLTAGTFDASPISTFLLKTRAGHCEYFATAGVLLLRAAGLPARYASGYSVQEFSRLEKQFVVRARHAHAWVLVFYDGSWHDFDPTPPDWRGIEADEAPFYQPISDLISLAGLHVSRLRWLKDDSSVSWKLGWIPVFLVFYLGWRLRKRKAVKRGGRRMDKDATRRAITGSDSDFYRVERQLNKMGYRRPPGETFLSWIARIDRETTGSVITRQEVSRALDLHYRYRFDPAGIDDEEVSRLNRAVSSWLERVR